MSAVDDILKTEEDNPSIGILLCKEKNKVKAEYALKDIKKPIGISEYELIKAIPEDLKSNLPTVEEIENETEEEADNVDTSALNRINPYGYLVFCTKNGLIKKTPVTEFNNIMRGGKRAITLIDGDELISVQHSTGNDDVLIASSAGKCIRFNETKIRVMGRSARGVRAMRIPENTKLVSMEIVLPNSQVLTITQNGFGKRTDSIARHIPLLVE